MGSEALNPSPVPASAALFVADAPDELRGLCSAAVEYEAETDPSMVRTRCFALVANARAYARAVQKAGLRSESTEAKACRTCGELGCADTFNRCPKDEPTPLESAVGTLPRKSHGGGEIGEVPPMGGRAAVAGPSRALQGGARTSDALPAKNREPLIHELKTWPEFYERIVTGEKLFEVRKDDRDFAPNDVLYLVEWCPQKGYTGRRTHRLVTLVLRGWKGIEQGHCVMSLAPGEWKHAADREPRTETPRDPDVDERAPDMATAAAAVAERDALPFGERETSRGLGDDLPEGPYRAVAEAERGARRARRTESPRLEPASDLEARHRMAIGLLTDATKALRAAEAFLDAEVKR